MNLLKPLIRISSITMVSRILGFVRDTIIARTFGVSIMTDAFFIAFKLSNLLRRIFADGFFYQVFLPILSEYKCFDTKKEIQMFIARTFGLLIIVLMTIIFAGLVIAPWIISIIVPGFDDVSEKFFITIVLFRIMLPYVLLISLTSLMGAILNVWNFFLIPAVTPIFLNISMIGCMLCLKYLNFNPPIIGLAWSVIIGGILQCIYYIPFLKKIDLLVLPEINLWDIKIRRICRSMSLVLIAISSNQISIIINTVLSSFLADGSVSWMYYADKIIELPLGVFGVTLTTILLPCLSKCVAKRNNIEYLRLVNWGIRLCCMLSFPSVIILATLSKPLVITLFQYGKFSEFDVMMTQYSVIAYSVGLPGLVLVKVLTAGFYARHDIKTPIQVIVITVIFAQCINIMCIHMLKHVTFAVSISLGSWLNVGLLYWKFKKKYSFKLESGLLYFFGKLIIALVVMCITIYIGMSIFVPNWVQGNIFHRLFRMINMLILGVSSYFITLWILGVRLKDFYFFNKDVN